MYPFCFQPAEILLPDFQKIDPTKWAVVACDQYTSEPEYWNEVEKEVGDAPSTLHLMLPEIFLEQSVQKIPVIHQAMEQAINERLIAYPDSMIYIERTQSDGRIRHGLIGKIDLEAYNYQKGCTLSIRATEGTVLERIPPRVKIRRDAPLELPHVMLLIDDPMRSVIEPLQASMPERKAIYDFDLMQKGGHVKGYFLTPEEQKQVEESLRRLVTPQEMERRYGAKDLCPLLFAVGDGNHSLATAKATYEEMKAKIGEEAAKNHPARYALAEVVNLHDDALQFEPIYRVLFGVNPKELLNELKEATAKLCGNAATQTFTAVGNGWEETCKIAHPVQQLTVGTLQTFFDEYLTEHPGATLDYIHGVDSLRKISNRPDAVGFLFQGLQKDELFKTVIFDGALPRKTFSMGHAEDKRFYLECRKIK